MDGSLDKKYDTAKKVRDGMRDCINSLSIKDSQANKEYNGKLASFKAQAQRMEASERQVLADQRAAQKELEQLQNKHDRKMFGKSGVKDILSYSDSGSSRKS